MCALLLYDRKKIIAISTIRQLGLVSIRIGNQISDLAFIHLLTHAMFKARLFLAAGSGIMFHYGHQDSRLFNSIVISQTPVIKIIVINLFALNSVPFTAGFITKENIVNCVISSYVITDVAVILFFSAIPLTFLYSRRLYFLSCPFYPLNNPLCQNLKISFTSMIPSLVLTMFAVFSGSILN